MMTDEQMYAGYEQDMKTAIHSINSDGKYEELGHINRKYNYNINHPDFPKEYKKYILDLMNRYPSVTFPEYCLVTQFQTMREESITYDIVPQKEIDVKLGEINLLDNII
jgi:hypothetical protein